MKKNLLKGLILVFISLNSFAQNNSETVDLLLKKTGALAEIKQFDAIFEAKIVENKATFENEADFEKFSKIMKSSFNSKDAESYFKEYILNNSNKENLQDILVMYDNPLFQKMNKIEVGSNNPEKQQEKMAFFQNMKTNPPSQERINKMIALNNELGTVETSVSMVKNIVFSMANGANLGQPIEKQIPQNELKQKLDSSLGENFSQQMTNQLVALSLYTYKDVEEKDLDEYIKEWSTPTGKYYMKLIMGAYDYSFSKMGTKMGESFKEFEKS